MTDDEAPSLEQITALGKLIEFVRDFVPVDMIEAHAFRLIGEPQEKIDAETRELFEALQRQSPPFSRGAASGLAFALRELVCERIRGIEDSAA